MIKVRKKITVLHIATLNRPIRPDLGYGPIQLFQKVLVSTGVQTPLCSGKICGGKGCVYISIIVGVSNFSERLSPHFLCNRLLSFKL